jgi:drug/metabolite transporter (DMT)-like permease
MFVVLLHGRTALMMIHQITCSTFSYIVVMVLRFAQPLNLSWGQIAGTVAPVAIVFSLSISLVNYGQMYISVKFLQMLKASLPTLSLLFGFCLGTETPSWPLFFNIAWICGGVMIASIAELDLEFHAMGTALALSGFCFESLRLVLSQKLLQGKVKFGPLTGVMYVAPLSFCTLSIPFFVLESGRFFTYLGAEHASGGSNFRVMLPYMVTNGFLAYGLNLSVYQVLQRTSAVTFGVLGQAKDWLNVLVALAVFGSPITTQQAVGYGIAVSGVGYYKKIRRDQATAKAISEAAAKAAAEEQV